MNNSKTSTTDARPATSEVLFRRDHQSDIGIVAKMLDLSIELAVTEMVGLDEPSYGEGYFIPRRIGDNLTALLIAAEDFARRSAGDIAKPERAA